MTYPVVADTFNFNSLVIGGGGGGGIKTVSASGPSGGGGGAGGFIETAHTGVTEGSYMVTVGAGGAITSDGGSSSIGSLVTALGGGAGGSGTAGHVGGSGGGGTGLNAGGSGTAGQGNNGAGGNGSIDDAGGGGGGGAGTAGSSGINTTGGTGGTGKSSSISGSAVTYAAGGGGGSGSNNGAVGAANTGNGGGGAGDTGSTAGAGGSGIIIISYPTGSMTATGGTITTSGGNTIHTFTSSGTFAITNTILTKPITVPAGHDKMLFVLAASYTDVDVSGITFDGDAMTFVAVSGRTISGTIFNYSLFKLPNPSAKTGDIVVTWDDPTSDMFFHAFVCDAVDQASPTTSIIDNGGTSTTASITLTSTKDYQLRIAAVISERASNTPDSPQTIIEGGDNNFGTDSTSYLGTSTNGALVDTTFNIKNPERITTLFGFDIDALVGTTVEGRNLARVLRWDTASDSWSAEDVVEENGVNAFIRDENYVYVQAGEFGRLYFYNGEQLLPYARIPGEWSPTQRAKIHQGAVATLLGVPVFGLSNVAGDPALQGVYSFGSYSKDYPKVLDLSFPVSSGAFSGVDTGAVLAKGADLFVAWKDGTGAGVDKLDYSAKYGSAYIETMMLSAPQERGFLKTALEACAYYASLPASTGITFGYKKKYDANYTTIAPVTDAKLCAVKARESIPEIANLQLKFGFTANGNDAPEVESFDYQLAPLKK